MNTRKTTKETGVPDTIVLAANEKKWPEVKAILKRREQMKKREEINSKLPEVIAFASKTFNKEFKSLQSLLNYVSKKNGKKARKSKRAPRLADEQKEKIRKMKKDGKSYKEIMADVGCTTGQISKVVAS